MNKYLAKHRAERSREIPVGVFSSPKENSLPLDMGGRDHNNVNIVLTSNERATFIHLLEKRMEIYPDALSVYRVAKIIGCSERTIRWHIAKGRLFATLQERKYLVSKYSPIKFLAGRESNKQVDELVRQRASADCSAVARIMRVGASHQAETLAPHREYKGFAMQPKSEWHEKAIKWFIEVMNK